MNESRTAELKSALRQLVQAIDATADANPEAWLELWNEIAPQPQLSNALLHAKAILEHD